MKRKSVYKPIFGFASFVLASLLLVNIAHADGTEQLGEPSIDIAQGSGILIAGTGLNTNQPGDISIEIPAGLTVNQVLLYWGGRTDVGSPLSGTNDTIQVNGSDVTGPLIGGPSPYSFPPSYTYRADITASNWVVAGAVNVLTVDGLDFDYQDDGAAVVVIWDDGSTTADIRIADGNDFAYEPLGLQTQPVTFPVEASDEERMAYVWLIVSDVTAPRPNAIAITVGGDTTTLTNELVSALGDFLDVVEVEVPVPAGATNVTVQILSIDDGSGEIPASLAWMFVAWELLEPVDEGCTYTIGYWKNHYDAWPISNPSFYSDADAKKLLWAEPKGGNAYIILAKQYIGAALNVGNEASIPSDVLDVWNEADGLLFEYKDAGNINKKTQAEDRARAIYLAGMLDDYNNGDLGPGHCD